jgi:lysozyme
MAISDYTLNLVKKFEGYTPKPKWDHKQYSVGYSTRWKPGSPVGTREDHEAALREEVGKIDNYIDKNITVPLDDNKRAALTSFGFNLGPGGIEKLLPDINSGNWDRVATRMLSFSRAGDNPNALVDRRKEEAGILLGGPLPASASSAPASSPSTASPQNEGDMLELLAALGGSGNLMGSLGKAMGSSAMTGAGGQNSVFGSLGALFGGGEGAGGTPAAGGNAAGDANMKLAQQGMQNAGGKMEGPQAYQRKPVDLSNLMKILQQRSQLGVGGRQPGPGLGA